MRQLVRPIVWRLLVLSIAFGCGSAGPPRGDSLELELEASELQSARIPAAVLSAALQATRDAWARGSGTPNHKLAIVDYTRHSARRRLWVVDLDTGELLFHERVAQGSGGFSNEEGSHASSLGLFTTGESYEGRNGTSLRLHGLVAGTNDNAFERAVVIHGARYVSDAYVADHGVVGHSHGCPAVRPAVASQLVETLEGGALLFAHGRSEI